jgi:hypothetical protein
MDNLRKPTAHVSDSEAQERAERLRQRDHHFNCTSSRPYVVTGNAQFDSFRKEWLRMMAREGDGFDS